MIFKLGKLSCRQAFHINIDQNDEDLKEYAGINAHRSAKILSIAILIVLFAIVCCIAFIYHPTVSGGSAHSSVRLNEIMSSSTACPNADGMFYDYIELYNDSDADADISGFQLYNCALFKGFVFDNDTVVPAHGYLVISCDGKNSGHGDKALYASFSISRAGGEKMALMNSFGTTVDSVSTVGLSKNEAMIRTESGEWNTFSVGTPGFENSSIGRTAYIDSLRTNDGLAITELMAKNISGITTKSGERFDWIELTNTSNTVIDLDGYHISDDPSELYGYVLPSFELQPNECVLLFASKLAKYEDGEIHTNFKLSSGSGTLTLVSPTGHVIDSVSYTSSQPDRSLIRTANGLESTIYSTPGFTNGTDGYIAYQESLAVVSPLIISEVMTANDTVLRQAYGRYFDWVEIKNAGEKPIQLSDYYLSDDYNNKRMWRMPDMTLAPGSYKIFICSGDEKLTNNRYTHTNFSLNSETETLFLFDQDGEISDRILLCDIPANVSAGRMDGQNGLFLFSDPTPGAQNTGGVRAVSGAPYSTTAAGQYETASLTIPLFSDGDIYYTTDGSWPDRSSKKYTEPIIINKSTVVRAIAYAAGSLKSSVTTLSYLLNEGNTLPIMSLSANPSDLWSVSSGIYSSNNVFKPWEKDAHLEFFDSDGSGFSLDCGLQLFGGGTREVSAKKSFQVRFREIYGESSLFYDMFEKGETNEFKSLVFRAGQDAGHTIFRAEIFPSIAVEESQSLLAQHSRYCLLYINGNFFGIYCIEERLGDDYYASHYNVSTESVEVINGPVKKNTDLYALMSYVSHNDMRKEENYEYVESKLDIDSLIDWYIFEACSGNNDISGNVRYMRSSEGDGKWRLALCDLDFTLRWPINNFEWLYNNSNQHSKFLKGLIKNPEFKDKFLMRFGYLLNNVFTEENLQARIDYLADQLRGDIARERQKWHSPYTWEGALEKLGNVLHQYDYKGRIVRSVCKTLSLTSAERKKYFGS